MSKKHLPAVTEAAREASTRLTSWKAVEASAKSFLKASEEATDGNNFVELHIHAGPNKTAMQGVVKAGNVILKIES